MQEVKYSGHYTEGVKSVEELTLKEKNILVKCINPSRNELMLISKKFDIPIGQLDKAIDPEERPTIEEDEKYTRITVSSPTGSDDHSKTASLSFFISDNYLLILSKKKIEAFDNLRSLPVKNWDDAFSKDTSAVLQLYLGQIINEYFEILDNLEDSIDRIESKLFKNFNNNLIKKIFQMKKTLIYFHKSLIANREVFISIDKESVKQIKKSDIRKYRGLYFDIVQLIDMVGTYREIITGSMDIYMSAVSNNLNEVIKRLTVYASYVMVPTLISGIYGMNFNFLPETEWKYGYFFSLGLMVISVLVIRHNFKKQGWI